jgi:hypothetical protein
MTSMDQPDVADFDPARAVAEYRRILNKRDAATDAPGKDEYDRLARILRTRWVEWQGEDSLHEVTLSGDGARLQLRRPFSASLPFLSRANWAVEVRDRR